VRACGFEARAHTRCLVPDARRELGSVLIGVSGATDSPGAPDPFCCADIPAALPAHRFRIRTEIEAAALERIAVGWGLGAYRFDRYREEGRKEGRERERAVLCTDPGPALRAGRQIEAIALVRDLINTPAGDLLPGDLFEAACALAERFGAECSSIAGDELIANGYPAIHAVGRASTAPPRLIDLRWGDPSAPRVTLAGKGVCFDSGGLNLKPASGMRLMKKDMGGAAHVLGLARLVMSSELPVRLRVLVPAVENAVAGNAYRPGDVLATRAGITVEVDNTDAEGRIVLCDALTEAVSEEPEALIDFATLTGAARIALGPDVPALFSNDDGLAAGLARHAEEVRDPLWRLPLHRPYDDLLSSPIADTANAASSPSCTSHPPSPWVTTAPTPRASPATTGTPSACASSIAMPIGSPSAGQTKRSQALTMPGSAGGERRPRKVTRPAPRSAANIASTSTRAGPSPTTSRCHGTCAMRSRAPASRLNDSALRPQRIIATQTRSGVAESTPTRRAMRARRRVRAPGGASPRASTKGASRTMGARSPSRRFRPGTSSGLSAISRWARASAASTARWPCRHGPRACFGACDASTTR